MHSTQAELILEQLNRLALLTCKFPTDARGAFGKGAVQRTVRRINEEVCQVECLQRSQQK